MLFSECNVMLLLCFCHRSSREEVEVDHISKQTRSASCPSPSLQGLSLPQSLSGHSLLSPSSSSSSSPTSSFPSSVSTSAVGRALPKLGGTGEAQESARRGSVLSRLMKRVLVEKGEAEKEGKEAELHLYAVSPTSRIYLHLLCSWSSYMIVRASLAAPVALQWLCFALCDGPASSGCFRGPRSCWTLSTGRDAM